MSSLVVTDNHMMLPTKVGYCGILSLLSASPSFLGPRSPPGVPGMFEVVGRLYYSTMRSANDAVCFHLENAVVLVTLHCATIVHL